MTVDLQKPKYEIAVVPTSVIRRPIEDDLHAIVGAENICLALVPPMPSSFEIWDASQDDATSVDLNVLLERMNILVSRVEVMNLPDSDVIHLRRVRSMLDTLGYNSLSPQTNLRKFLEEWGVIPECEYGHSVKYISDRVFVKMLYEAEVELPIPQYQVVRQLFELDTKLGFSLKLKTWDEINSLLHP